MTSPPVLLFAFANERQDERHYLRALADERRAIKATLAPAVRAGLCIFLELPNATLADIFATFQDDRYRDRIALFHYGGHAAHDELLLEKNDRENAVAYSGGLISLLKNQKGLEMVFLNGCHTEKWALELNEAGVAIVAGTFEAIRDQAAQQLAVQFYAGLGQGLHLRRAWEEAVALVRSELGDSTRGLGREGFQLDRFPWALFQRPGADKVNQWNLPDATGDPLAALPLPDVYQQLSLPNEPFRFLDRYRRADAAIFFGRGRDIRELYDRLTHPFGSPLLLLSGQSGIGKSSLLEAGLLPRLEAYSTILYLRRDADTDLNATLEVALGTLLDAEEAGGDDARTCWMKIEQQKGRPLVCMLDQAEEAFTRDGGGGVAEVEAFARTLGKIFGDIADRPAGKVLLGFRKEYEAEIEDVFKQQKIPYESVFLKRLSHKGILEVVNGLSSSPRLLRKYGLRVEEGLPELIAADLLADSDTPVSPVLQIILTKMWQGLPRGEDRQFTQAEYLRLKENGIFLGDFFRQQMEKLRNWEERSGQDVESSGLALDVLHLHTTDFGFSSSRGLDELKTAYQHRADVLEELVKRFKELYLLTDAGEKRSALAHDTLGPVVQQEVNNSDRPGQKALRILTGKTAGYRHKPDAAVLDEADLTLVELGEKGMRFWRAEEVELIRRSRQRRAKRRLQRVFVWATLLLAVIAAGFGYTNYRKNRIAYWVAQAGLEANTDPTTAMHTLQKAIELAPYNLGVMAARNDLFSNHEFYERSLPHPAAVKGVILAPDTSGALYSWTETTIYRWSGEGVKKDTLVTQSITDVVLSADGLVLIVSAKDGGITRLEAVNLGEEKKAKPFGTAYATHLVFSADGQTIFAAGTDHSIFVLNARDLSLQHRFPTKNRISSLALHPYRNSLLVGYFNGDAEERYSDGGIVRALRKHEDRVLAFAVSPLDSSVTSGGRDAQLLFGAAQCLQKGHDRSIKALQWSPDGNRLFSAGNDYRIKTWSPEGDLVSVYLGHKGFVNGLSVSPDGQYFASASEDKTVRVWKTESKVIRRYGPHPGGVSGVLLASDHQTVITVSDAGVNDGAETSNDLDFDFAEFNARLSTLSPRAVLVWGASKGDKKSEWTGHAGAINALSADGKGTTIATAADEGSIRLWDAEGEHLKTLSEHRKKVRDVAVSPDGRYLASVGEDSLAILWAKDGSVLKRIPHGDVVRTVAFSPDGGSFATGCDDGSLRLFDSAGEIIQILVQPSRKRPRVESLCFAPDGQTILAGELGTSARLYDLSGRVIAIFDVFAENKIGGRAIRSVAISPDGNSFALGAEGGLAQVFQLVNNNPIPIFQLQHYPKKAILHISFTLDGKGILTGSNDRWARWWRIGIN